MKIQIVGYSGSGKSTFAKNLSDKLNIPLMHLDRVNFHSNFIQRDETEVENEINEFIKNDSWVIDGNYRYKATSRFDLADVIIFFNFNRIKCFYGVLRRRIKYHNRQRESAPDGFIEKLSFEFFWWVVFEGRRKNRRQFFKELIKTKKVIVFKNRRQVNRYLKNLDDKMNKIEDNS